MFKSLLYSVSLFSLVSFPGLTTKRLAADAAVLRTIPRTAPESLLAEAPIWGQNDGANGYAFLPVTIQGKHATIVLDFSDEGDLALSDAALARLNVAIPATAQSASLTIGTATASNIPLRHITKPTWTVHGPDTLPPVVGIAGVHFLFRYDILYDFPGRRVRVYAVSPAALKHPVAAKQAWLPKGVKPTDCGAMVPIPSGAGTFTGMMMQLDGHPVTGVFEMGPYYPKMNQGAFDALGLPKGASRIQPIPDGKNPPGYSHNGYTITQQVTDVHMTVGEHMFWTGDVQLFPSLDVESLLSPKTPVMLLNLTILRHVVLFNAVSSRQVCLSVPGPGL